MMRRKFFRLVNFFLAPMGIELSAKQAVLSSKVRDPVSSYMKDPSLQTTLIKELVKVANTFFTTHINKFANKDFDFESEIQQFWEIYRHRPFAYNKGGSGFHNAFWIYLFSRLIDPLLIVESGVWKGQTSWLLEQACPNTTIHGFDINLSNLEYTGGKVHFHEQDWSTYQFPDVPTDKSLVFFDCHVNHARRIIEAYNKGFYHLLFDDNPPLHKLYTYKRPGIPTANMVHNAIASDSAEIAWYWQGEERVYQIDTQEVLEAKKLIEKHAICPDVGGATRYGGFSFLTYVRLSSKEKLGCTI